MQCGVHHKVACPNIWLRLWHIGIGHDLQRAAQAARADLETRMRAAMARDKTRITMKANSATTMATRAAFTPQPRMAPPQGLVGTGLNCVEMISAAGPRSFMPPALAMSRAS